jgi:hydroxypyruvate isomerase
MPKLAANITMLFTEYPFADRFGRAAANGFGGVEALFPYELKPVEISDLLREHHLDLVLFNLPAGDWAAGDRGLAASPERVAEFRNGVDLAVTYAEALKPRRVNCLVGKTDDLTASRRRRPTERVLGRESAVAALDRFESAVNAVVQRHAEGNIAIVSHGTVIALFAAEHSDRYGFELWREMGLPSFAVFDLPDYHLREIVARIGG